MRDNPTLAERLAPDTIARLERAAQQRFATAELLRRERRLAALYFYGYSAEICLSTAYFRHLGFGRNMPIDRDTRQRRMAQARQVRENGEFLMSSDPHPLVGWARFLQWQRKSSGGLSEADQERLREAIKNAIVIYNYWRPEMRYKILEYSEKQLDEVRRAARWFIDNQENL
jgi:hypothetical protein